MDSDHANLDLNDADSLERILSPSRKCESAEHDSFNAWESNDESSAIHDQKRWFRRVSGPLGSGVTVNSGIWDTCRAKRHGLFADPGQGTAARLEVQPTILYRRVGEGHLPGQLPHLVGF
jgi:hypothetical protein